MGQKKLWDLSSTHALEAAAEWLRRRSGALAVVVVRVGDAVLSADAALAPRDAYGMVCGQMGALREGLESARRQKRTAAGVYLDGLHE